MRNIVSISLAAVLALAGATHGEDTSLAYSKDKGASVYLAKGWTQGQAPSGQILRVLESKTKSLIQVGVEDLPAPMTVEQYVKAAKGKLPKTMTVQSERDVSVAGLNGTRMLSHYAGPRGVVVIVQYIVIKGTRAYIVSGGAAKSTFEKHSDRIELVMRTFQLHAKKKKKKTPAEDDPKKTGEGEGEGGKLGGDER